MDVSNKSSLRERYKNIREKIKNKDIKSDIIFQKLLKNDILNNSSVIALYKNLPVEVDTSKIIEALIELKKIVVLPKVVGSNKLIFCKISNIDELVKNKFGIFEPIDKEDNHITKDNIDLFIIPGVCFDKNRNRLGFGKGYYDYYLENCKAKKIGICFDEQITEQDIDVQKYDIKMDLIITDKKEF